MRPTMAVSCGLETAKSDSERREMDGRCGGRLIRDYPGIPREAVVPSQRRWAAPASLWAVAALLALASLGLGARPADAQLRPTVTPTVDCVEYDPDTNTLTGHFGYTSTYDETHTIQYGSDNFFLPIPNFRSQPFAFEPGTHRDVFVTSMNLGLATELAWSLNFSRAVATNDPDRYCATDVSLALSHNPEPVLAGEELTYALTATNRGPVQATGVKVTSPLAGGTELVSAQPSQGSCAGTEEVSCDLGTLPKDASARVVITLRPGDAGTLVHTGSVQATQPDRDSSNNSASARTPVVAPPAVAAGPAADLAPGGATLYGSVDPKGSETIYRFEYGADDSYGRGTPEQAVGGGGGIVRAELSGLEPGTTYHYRLVATNAHGTSESEDRTFTTPTVPPPEESRNTAPTFGETAPVRGSRTRDRTPTIRATVRDAQTDLAKRNVRLWVDGRRVERFSYDRATDRLAHTAKRLGPGRHTVLIVARDGEGLSRSRLWGFGVRKR